MAKSVGNIRSLAGALDEYGRDALVMYFVSGHYRQPLAFSQAELEQAARSLERVRDLVGRLDPDAPGPEGLDEPVERFYSALAEDFNTPGARAALFDWISEANRRLATGERFGPGELAEMLRLLGLETLLDAEDEQPGPEAVRLLQEREAARVAREFELADRKRDDLAALGWQVRDTPEGPRLVRRS
jgi:cysteinyl-tRNA synthetase